MGVLRSHGLQLAIAIIFACGITACGGHHTVGQSPFPGKITLSPGGTSSVQSGTTLNFSASAQNAAGSNISATFTFSSSDTSILNVASNGVACAGVWDVSFTTCTPAGTGVVQVTASAFGGSSLPTYVFVHPPIDNITVTGILPTGAFIQEPCLPQGQLMTVQAQAFSGGVDVTASVGPFVWSANNSGVVKLTPIPNPAYNFATNQATATAVNPGLTEIFAAASGVTSTSFQQPDLNPNAPSRPIFDFFETCPVQNITLELGHAGSGITDFAVAKGTPETVVATITDVLGNSSLQNSNNGVVLSKIPLTWSATRPTVVNVGSGCDESCAVSTSSPGAGSVTASCSPPTCNVGFPEIPQALSAGSLANCTSYIHALFPQITSCAAFIPSPVYAAPLPNHTTAAISGLVEGTTGTTTILATSQDCAYAPPSQCGVGLYSFATGKALTGGANGMPDPPNSLLFDNGGDKAYVGSGFGAQIVNPSNLGTANSAFTPIGTVTGRVLAVSPNGSVSVFSDTLHTPNQVYVVSTSNGVSPGITPLNISSASVAGFSPDNLKAYIFGLDSNNLPNLYVYSSVQAVQVIPLPPQTSVSAVAFSTNSAFAYVAEPSLAGGGPAFSVLNTCDNQPAITPVSLSSTPIAFKALPDGVHFVALESNGTVDYITAAISSVPAATLTSPATYLCSETVNQTLQHSMTVTHSIKNINLNLGNSRPLDFFVSADGTLLYVLSSDLNSIIVYDFALGSVTGGIQLISTAGGINPTPVTAQMTADAGTIVVAASDGYIHQVSTAIGGSDVIQNQFSNLPNYSNPFCTYSPASGPCTLDLIAVKP